MDIGSALLGPVLVVVALVAVTTAAGMLLRRTTGRARDARRVQVLGAADGIELGARATLVQFSSEVCSACVATSRHLRELAGRREGVRHLELDVAEHPELTGRLSVMQTPTTLILDPRGRVATRIGGAPRPGTVEAELTRMTAR